jgi:hypothetical protein
MPENRYNIYGGCLILLRYAEPELKRSRHLKALLAIKGEGETVPFVIGIIGHVVNLAYLWTVSEARHIPKSSKILQHRSCGRSDT